MKCPIDSGVDLLMSDRNGIEIDYCPTCRGVWLDRGELDKIIERAAPSPAPATTAMASAPTIVTADDRQWKDDRRASDDRRPIDDRFGSDHRDGGYPKKKKRESFLGDLFDF